VINPNEQKMFSSFFSSKKKVPTDYLRGEIVRFKNKEDIKKPKSKVPESDYQVVCKVRIYRFFLFFLFFFVCCIVVVGAHTLSLLQVQGSWLSCIEFDGERFWEWNDSKLKIYTPIPVDDPLPSDSRFREDCKYLAKGDLETAGEYVFPMALSLYVCVCRAVPVVLMGHVLSQQLEEEDRAEAEEGGCVEEGGIRDPEEGERQGHQRGQGAENFDGEHH